MIDTKELVRIETPVGAFWTRPDDFVNRQLTELGGHQLGELGMMKSFARESDVILDVGAHIGTICIPLALQIGPSGRVFAFEPVGRSAEILALNIAENGVQDRVSVVNRLVSDSPEEVRLHLSSNHTSAAYFVPAAQDSAPALNNCETIRIDDWIEDNAVGRVDMIKIDTEGMELKVLRGARETIAKYLPVLVVEISRPHLRRNDASVGDVENMLRPFGYHFFRNLGCRHAAVEKFRLSRLWTPRHATRMYDLIAIRPDSPRYPRSARSGIYDFLWWMGSRVKRRLLSAASRD